MYPYSVAATLRVDAEGDHAAVVRCNKSLPTGGEESGGIADHVIGGKRQHDRLTVSRLRKRRTGRDRRT